MQLDRLTDTQLDACVKGVPMAAAPLRLGDVGKRGWNLLKGDLQGIVRARHLSRATMRNIRQNLFFAFVFNALAVPIAAGVIYPALGLLLNPMIASAAMSMSSVLVVTNALRLRTVRL